MVHKRHSVFGTAHDVAPRIELLEDRLPPGDAMLGAILGIPLLESEIYASERRLPSKKATNVSITSTAALALIEAAPAVAVANAERISQVQGAADPHESGTRAVPSVRPISAGVLPGRTSGVRMARTSVPLAENAESASASDRVVAPDVGHSRPTSVSVSNVPPSQSPPVLPIRPNRGETYAGPPEPLFTRGTSDEYVEQVYQNIDRMWGGDSRYWLGTRWSGTQGSPRTVTWSFVPDGLSISSGVGEGVAPSETFSRLDSLFSGQGGRPTWINRFQQIFDRWEQLSGIDYTRVTSGGNDWDDGASWGSAGSATRGDIRISMKPIDGGSSILAYNYYPSNGDMVLDRWESWGSSTNSHRFLRNIVAHENGHGIGIAHVCCNSHTMLMEPFLSTSVDGPQHDDIRAAQRHYGDPQEDDNSAAAATNIGTLTSGVTKDDTCNLPAPVSGSNPASTSNCSIDGDGEQDYFKFTVSSASEVDVTVTPLGFSYNDNQQAQNGSCPTGSTTNSLNRANLNLQLIDTNGSTVLATAASQGAGQAESFNNVVVPAGTYYIRVYEGDTPSQTQLYTFSVRADSTSGATHLGVSAPASSTAGTPISITVTALNGNNQPDTNYQGTIHFTSNDPQAVLPPDYTYTPADQGVHVFSATLKTSGSRTITATDIANASITGNDAIQVDPAAASTLQVAGFPSPTTAGVQHSVTITARDPYGNTATGYTGTVDVTSSDSQATLPPDYTFVPADAGVKTLPVTLKTVGTQSITATDTVTGSITGTQSGITVDPATATSLELAGFPSTTTAGDQHTVTVTLRDAYGNTATGYTGTVHFTSSDGQATLPADYTFIPADAGVKSFPATLKTAGIQSITATDTANGALTSTQSGITVDPAAAATLEVSGYPSPTTAGDSHSFTVTARDAYGNVAVGYTGTVTFTSDDPQAVLPVDATLTNGTGTFNATLKTAGTRFITATDTVTGSITGSQTGISVNPAAAATFSLTTNSSFASVGNPFSVTLTVFDAYQNVATGYTGTVTFTSSDAIAGLPADYSFVVGDQGTHVFSVTLNTAGVHTVTATDTVNGSLTDSVTKFVVDSAPLNPAP
jgi:hypothetical protein